MFEKTMGLQQKSNATSGKVTTSKENPEIIELGDDKKEDSPKTMMIDTTKTKK